MWCARPVPHAGCQCSFVGTAGSARSGSASFVVAFVAASLALSAYRGLLSCSALYFAATYAYNEGGLATIGVLKSALSAVGYVCYGWGMTVCFGQSGNDWGHIV